MLLRQLRKKLIKEKTGARALRGIVEEIMLDLMYSLPSQTKIKKFQRYKKKWLMKVLVEKLFLSYQMKKESLRNLPRKNKL